MRVLVTNHHLVSACGSETFTLTLVEELARRGHDVSVFAFVLGEMAIRVGRHATLLDRAALSTASFDLALVNHATCQRAVGSGQPVIRTCHGCIPGLEQPVPGADHYVAISEEVGDHLSRLGFPSTIIRNGVDCERFRPVRKPSPRLERVLLLSNYEAAARTVAEACEMVGATFARAGGAWSTADVAGAINEADLVVSLGRGVYEALACARNVVVFDRRSYDEVQGADGFVTPEVLPALLRHNCSGRARGWKWDARALADAFRRYDPELGEGHRAFALEHLSVVNQVDRYLELTCASPV